MKKTYPITVDCANCANLMEQAVGKLAGVADARVNFMTQKLTVAFTPDADTEQVMQAVCRACKRIEPDFTIGL